MRTRLSLFCDKVVEAGWLAALVIVPLFFNIYSQRVFEPDKLSLLRSLALLMSAAWLVRVVEDWRSGAGTPSFKGRAIPVLKIPMVLPTLLLVLVYLISTAFSVAPAVSFFGSYQRLQGTYTTLSYVIIFFLMLEGLRTRRQIDRIVTTVILVSFPIAMYGLVQHFGLDPLPWGGNVTTRVAANLGNAIFVAAYLIMVVPLTLSRLLENWREAVGPFDKRDGFLSLVAFALLAAALLAAMLARRGSAPTWLAWVALAIGIGLQVPIYLLTSAERRNRVLAISLPLTFAFLVGLSWVQEIMFPPPPGEEAPGHLWLGILAALVFVLAMVALAYYLRKPVFRLLLLAGYSLVLIAQLVCIFYTQSRGPVLGLGAGLLVYALALGLVKRRVWLAWATGALAAAGIVGLVAFNTVASPLIETLRDTPYLGRLGKVLQTEEGTGKVRVLIWQGVLEMIEPHEPLQAPGETGGEDRFNALRPLLGYGPESMYVAYNRFYPPDLAHYEKRNASPDRSHNETFDALATTGIVGFVVYMLVFASVFYYALKWLGLIREAWQKWTFLGMWIGGGVLGGLAVWAWRGPVYLGVGVPGGTAVVGLGGYLFLLALAGSVGSLFGQAPAVQNDGGRWRQWSRGVNEWLREAVEAPHVLLLLALFSALAAHFVEIHFGIAIAATRTYFWVYVAMMVVIGTRFLARPAEDGSPMADAAAALEAGARRAAGAADPKQRVSAPASHTRAPAGKGEQRGGTGSKAGRRGASQSAGRVTPRRGQVQAPTGGWLQTLNRDWWGSIWILSLLVLLVLGTLLFDFVTVQGDEVGLLGTIWQSLTQRKETASPIMLVLVLSTWAVAALVGLGDLASRDESAGQGARDWLQGLGCFLGITFLGTLLFGLLHATRLHAVTLASEDAANPLLGTISFYYLFAFAIVVGVAVVMAFVFRHSVVPWKRTTVLADVATIGCALLLPALVVLLVEASNVRIVRADILYKQGLSSEKASQWDGAIFFYDRAIDLARDEDFYYLYLGRALMEQGRRATGEERETLLKESEAALKEAREIAPLNTDHSANLARLYRTWGGLSTEPQRTELLNRALAYYADATSLSPNNAQIFNEWGQTYAVLGQVDKALETYGKSVSLDSRFAQTYLLIGELYASEGKWTEAAEAYGKALEITPKSVDALSSLGYVYSQQGDLQRALEVYLRAVELRPTNYTMRKNLALLYQQLGRKEEALREANEALALAPEDEKEALQAFVAQLGGQPADMKAEDAQRVQDLLGQSQQQIDGSDWSGAEATLKQVLELDPRNVQAHSGLAYAYARLGRVNEAITENEAVLELMPDNYASLKNLALLYKQAGRIDEAIAAARRALTGAPDEDKQGLEAFLSELEQSSGMPTPGVPAGVRAGDLAPAERDGMYAAPPPMAIDAGKSYQATLVTDKGEIVVDLAAAEAPQTVNNFAYLSQQGFYDGLTFHRVENQPGFALIQGGDPTGTGRGGPGYTIPAEIGLSHDAGAIAMARLPDQVNSTRASSGSQFYICLVPIHQLDGAYTVFGYVTGGLDVAQRISVGDKILKIEIEER